MAALPPVRKFSMEDYPTERAWISPFLSNLNSFVSSVVDALTKGLTLAENTTSDVRSVVLSSVPTLAVPVSFAWTKKVPPKAVIVGNVTCSTGDVTLTDAVQIQYKIVSTAAGSISVSITNVVGIVPTSTAQYTLTLLCIAG